MARTPMAVIYGWLELILEALRASFIKFDPVAGIPPKTVKILHSTGL